MKRVLALLLISVFGLSACASTAPPQKPNNACAIFDEKPRWWRAVRESASRWGAPISVQLAIMRHESSFKHDARPPKKYFLWVVPNGRVSSAYGYSQAIDSTWNWYRRDTGRWGADRDDFDDAADFVGWYMSKTRKLNGVSMSDAQSQYLAYHEGHNGYKRGSYRRKGWLMNVARRVGRTAAMYRSQLSRCGGDL
ncbi:MAG: transglycosylase SLT domain-containing protein [Rhodobacteraceae bacterium]|nr:transglycosylase SLT domain-containing protein [Paracoccaceae bacterium]